MWRGVKQENTGLLEWMDKSNCIYNGQTPARVKGKVYKTAVKLELMYGLEELLQKRQEAGCRYSTENQVIFRVNLNEL